MYNYYDNRKMVYDFIKRECLRLRQLSHENLEKVKSVEEWVKRREFIKCKLLESIGGLPEKMPLNPILVNRIEKSGYVIENIILESLPGIEVNLNLYMPLDFSHPLPAVVFATGHSSKLSPEHQYPVQGLVRKGYAVATFDCYGRGERSIGNEHFEVGPLCWLNGTNMNRYFINDNIRVIDYLCIRPEIDRNRIGCTGTSGGGNTTLFHAALDERVKCAVSVCTPASFNDYLLLEYSACPEFYPIGLLGEGIDIQDIICLITPRPFMFIGGGKDFINHMPSLREACKHAAKIYGLYGKESNITYFIDENGNHGYNLNMRVAMYDWMDGFLAPSYKGDFVETSDENRNVLEDAKTVEFLTHPACNLLDYENMQLEHNRENLYSSRMEKSDKGLEILKDLLGINNREPKYKVALKKTTYQGINNLDEVVIETEEGIFVPMIVMYPEKEDETAGIVFVMTDEGKDRLLMPNCYKEELDKGCIIVAADLRGMGDTKLKNTPWDHYEYCSADRALAGVAIVMGYPLIGQRVYDALSILKYMQQNYKTAENIRLYGKGHSGAIAKLIVILTGAKEEKIDCGLIPYENLFKLETACHIDMGLLDHEVKRFKYEYGDVLPGVLKFFQWDSAFETGQVKMEEED